MHEDELRAALARLGSSPAPPRRVDADSVVVAAHRVRTRRRRTAVLGSASLAAAVAVLAIAAAGGHTAPVVPAGPLEPTGAPTTTVRVTPMSSPRPTPPVSTFAVPNTPGPSTSN